MTCLRRGWRRLLVFNPWLTFVLMGLFFGLFGITTVNLFVIFRANIELFVAHGAMVIGDGALLQLLQLMGYLYLSMVFYVLFKSCEHALVAHLSHNEEGKE